LKIRDRIKELRRVKASDLLPNPRNWRMHPQQQQDAMRGVLSEVGIADAVLAYETADGLMLIDGHLRADVAPDVEWPVLVLDVTPAEADILLATHDPLTAMADTDATHLDALLREVNTGSEALSQMLAGVASDAGLYKFEDDAAPGDPAPIMPDDPMYKIVIECNDEPHQVELLAWLDEKGVKCQPLIF